MKRMLTIAACAVALPGVTCAATRSYDTAAFESVSIAAGIDVDIIVGSAHGVTAETWLSGFDELRVTVDGNVLRIDRPPHTGFFRWFRWTRPDYKVHIATPALHSLTVSSGADAKISGNLVGDLAVSASSGSDVEVTGIQGGKVTVRASSGSDLTLGGRCASLDAEASSGSDLDADKLMCEDVAVRASSGSDMSVAATQRVTGHASSGSDVLIRGRPALVQVERGSGADVTVRE
jgi:hypothetical protein